MPKKSKKSLSKRVKLKDKFKVIRKVKEHNRKQRKEAKKQGTRKQSVLRDPGIPANFPYRDKVVKEFQFEQQRILSQAAARKEESKRKRQAAAQDENDDSDMSEDDDGAAGLSAVRAAAEAEQAKFQNLMSTTLPGISFGEAGNTQTFYKEFKKVVSASDVILQVLDARDPQSCRCYDIERFVRQVDPNKKIILVLNKVDLVPTAAARQWLKYLREELPAIAFKAATKKSGQIGQKPMPRNPDQAEMMDTSECLGGDTLLQLLKNYTRNKNIKTAITVGVVGLPNVGKSSLINSLKRTRVANVGNAPGITRSVQEIHLDRHIRLLDSPGLVIAAMADDAAGALYGGTKLEKLADPVSAVAAIVARVPARLLMTQYKVGTFNTHDNMLQQVAQARGKLKRGGTADLESAARIVLTDWRDGKLPFHTLPPARGNEKHEHATVVSEYSREFDANAVFAAEEQSILAKLDEDAAAQIPHATAVPPQAPLLTQTAQSPVEDNAMEAMMLDGPRGSSELDIGLGQSRVLYSEHGQTNPAVAKAAKKRARKKKAAEHSQ
eukprot:jgi/Ulvmu1/5102/UM021_0119.1